MSESNTPSLEDSDSLVAQLRAGDPQAVCRLTQLYEQRIRGMARYLMKQNEGVTDLVDSTMGRQIANPAGLAKGTTNREGLLSNVMHRMRCTFIDKYRSSRAQKRGGPGERKSVTGGTDESVLLEGENRSSTSQLPIRHQQADSSIPATEKTPDDEVADREWLSWWIDSILDEFPKDWRPVLSLYFARYGEHGVIAQIARELNLPYSQVRYRVEKVEQVWMQTAEEAAKVAIHEECEV